MFTSDVTFPGVRVSQDNISFDNENMRGKVDEKVIELYKDRAFKSIFIGHQKKYLGTILSDIAANFQAPKTLDLDLFYDFEDLALNAALIRKTFEKWSEKDVEVIFRCSSTVLKTFKL